MSRLIAILAVMFLSGCISTTARVVGCWGEPYVGTRLAYSHMDYEPLLVLDLPFDAVLDTALLPIDLILMPFL